MAEFVATQAGLERAALRLVARPDVRRAIADQARRWRSGTPGFLPETYARLAPSIDEVALLVALQVVNSDARRPQVVEISAGPHSWGDLEVPGSRWGINNPDTLYFAVPVEPTSTYVLRGRPRGPGAADLTIPTDINISVQIPDVWGTLDSLGRRGLVTDPDGSFAITVGNRSVPDRANQLPIQDGGSVLMIRQTLADWTGELPYELSIERLDGPEPAPPATEDEQAQQLIRRLEVVIEHSLHGLQPPIFRLPPNVVPQPGAPADKPGYLVAQRNTLGHFRLDEDQALVLVISPGGAGYAAVAAPNIWGVTSDSARHQNSLNSHQAQLDPDGRFTVVVANTDPGIANWVDPGGLREGILMLRWQLLTDDPAASEQPGVTARTVTLAELATVLPDTARVTPEQRQQLAAERRDDYTRRFRVRRPAKP